MAFMRDKTNGHIIETDRPDLWTECERLKNKEGAALYRAQQCKELRKLVKPGSTVYTTLKHCSRSGMSRHISLSIATTENRKPVIRDITFLAAAVMGDRVASDGGIVIGGCGMDMGFALVYNLGRTLYPKGAKYGRGGKPDTDGGYALRHSWT
jgi:hypothetical protein